MTSYKLTYFDVTAKAETLRMMFKVAGVKFEDVRIGFEEFGKMKESTPFGQLPMMEIDGKVTLCQTRAIARLLAKRFNLYGKTDLEQAKSDMVLDCLADIRPSMEKIVFAEKDKTDGMRKEFMEEKAPGLFANLEKMVDDGHFVGNQLNVSDIELFNLVQFSKVATNMDLTPILSKNPKLMAILKNVEQNPKIAEWLKTRPKTKF